jgi:hypothetical protein
METISFGPVKHQAAVVLAFTDPVFLRLFCFNIKWRRNAEIMPLSLLSVV